MEKTAVNLTLAHVSLQNARDIAKLSSDDLAKQWQNPLTIPIPSGEDIVALLARAIPHDLLLTETTLRGEAYQMRPHPLAGLTVVIEADDLAMHTVEALQQAVGIGQQETVWALAQASQQYEQASGSQRLLRQALQGRYTPSESDPVLAAAALLSPLLHMVETAVAQHHSLILRYERPSATPPTAPWRNFMVSQLRPFLLADLFAAIYLLLGLVTARLQLDWTLFITCLLLVVGFLLPLWSAQGLLWLYAQWHGVKAELRPWQPILIEDRNRPFFLSLYKQTFFLNSLYQPSPQSPQRLPPPQFIYLAFVGFSLFLLLTMAPLWPQFPLLTPFLIAICLSSILFGLSHLIEPRYS